MPFSHLSLLDLRDRDQDEDRELAEWRTRRQRDDSFARTSEPPDHLIHDVEVDE